MADQATGPGPLPAGATVLVADDEPDVRTVLRLMLRRSGVGVLEAVHGREAVERVRDHDAIDAVLLDVMMPEMTGPEALSRIRDLVPTMPAVFVSGYERDRVAEHLGERPVHTGFLPKPFGREELVAAVTAALRSRE